ncbi:MAG: glycosyltransferase [Deltaproteobacteria bacterium]|nr:glycosyltransferase [Deltaproteobacteria bacterium]
MGLVARGLFWGAAAVLGATWVGYPLWLRTRPRREVRRGPFTGTIGVVCVARDEAAHITRRVDELRAQTRAPERVVVVDDGSADDTAARAEAAGAVVVQRPAEGKAAGLGAGVDALGEVDLVVFCDVRQRLAPDALERLARAFADPEVGCASGLLTIVGAQGPGLWWRYETMVRLLESRSGSVVGATGALYAVRRALFVAPPSGLVLDDVWVPMHVARQGFRVVLEQDAHALDVEAEVAREARRKLRTLAGNHQLVRAAPWLRSPRGNPLFSRFLWHKRMRLVAPLALGVMGVSAAVEARRPLYRAVAVGLGAAVATWAVRQRRPDFGGRLGAMAETFVALHVSAARAWWEARRGDIRWASGPGDQRAR